MNTVHTLHTAHSYADTTDYNRVSQWLLLLVLVKMNFRWNQDISIMVHFHIRYLITTLSCFNEYSPHFACSSFICCYNWLQSCIAMVTAATMYEHGFSTKFWHFHHGAFSHSIFDNNFVMFQWGHPTLCIELTHMLLQLIAIVYCNGCYCD